ncbi:MAG TPA: CorA family divalent cation transporter, partial [Chitinophagaceae bacterium]|nr:CorA family divalent cation transporter [Chitinophagaceae bacterium]
MKWSLRSEKYLRYIVPSSLLGTHRTKEILTASQAVSPTRADAQDVIITVYDYDAQYLHSCALKSVEESFGYRENGRVTWINVDGIRKSDVEKISTHYVIHPLTTEDILSINQRPKKDEIEGTLYCLLNKLYYDEKCHTVEQEQVSIVLGSEYVITFQEDPQRDVFNPIRERLAIPNSKLRQRNADYLCYSMLDLIVDNYFLVMEKLSEQIETTEEE